MFWERFTRFHHHNLPKTEIEKEDIIQLNKTIDKICNKLVDSNNLNILLYGLVQSGKTKTYLGIISKYFDEIGNFVILFPAIDHDLEKQTLKRVRDLYNEAYIIDNIYITSFNNDISKVQIFDIIRNLKNEKKVIFSCLKNHKTMNNFLSFLTENKEILNFIKNPLIIDDEGDQASLNDIKYSDKGISTPTNQAFIKLLELLKTYKYLTVTATPYPHFVSANDKLKPDYCFLLKPGKDYVSLGEFIESNNLISVVSENDVSKLPGSLIDSLRQAIISFLLLSYFYTRTNKMQFICTQMILNTSGVKNDHVELANNISNFINKLAKSTTLEEDLNVKTAVQIVSEKISNNQNYKKHEGKELEILREILASNSIMIKVINSDSTDEVDNKKTYNLKTNRFCIYIGSNLIQRGVSFDWLLVTFLTKRAKDSANADTILQSSRFLGYRRNILDFTLVYLSSNIFKDLYLINNLDINLRDLLYDAEVNDKKIQDCADPLFLDVENFSDNEDIIKHIKKLKPTRKTVGNTELDNSVVLRNYIHEDLSIRSNNQFSKALFKNLCKNIATLNIQWTKNVLKGNFPNYPIQIFNNIEDLAKEINDTALLNNLAKTLQINKSALENLFMKKDLKIGLVSMIANHNLEKWDDYPKYRSIKTVQIDGKVRLNQLESGHNFRGDTLGDRFWYIDNPNYIFIQVYPIVPKYEHSSPTWKIALLSSSKIRPSNIIRYKTKI